MIHPLLNAAINLQSKQKSRGSFYNFTLYKMYQGKPKLKKITQVNLNNPTLNSFNMRGIFFEPVPPQIVRDQLLYHPGFKDALQQTVQQQQKRYRQSITPKQSYSLDRQTPINQDYEPLRKRYGKNEVLDKITQLPVQQTFDSSLNYRGYQTIKNKQLHGFNIISNF